MNEVGGEYEQFLDARERLRTREVSGLERVHMLALIELQSWAQVKNKKYSAIQQSETLKSLIYLFKNL